MTLVPYGPLGQDKTGQSLTILKYLLIFFLTSLRKNIFIFINTWKPSTKIVNFMFSGEGSSNAGPKWPHTGSDNAYNVKKYYPPLPHICKIN